MGWLSRRSSGWRATAFRCSSPSTAASPPPTPSRGHASWGWTSSSPTTTGRPRCCPSASGSAPARPTIPFPELCGTGVVFKLAQALHARAGRDATEMELHLDLVALATVADVVPLLDENRGLVRAGPAPARGGRRSPACGRSWRWRASIAPTPRRPIVGFRLAPRINAAGRLCHPDRGARAPADHRRRPGPRARRAARGAEPRAPGGRGRDPAPGRLAGRGGRRGVAGTAGLRAARSRLARGRDRDRRLTARRALRAGRSS